MPWNHLTSLLKDNRNRHRGSVEGFCGDQQAVLVKLESPLPEERQAKLTFPCGQSLSAEPLWQRRSDQRESLAAFPLGAACPEELESLGELLQSDEVMRSYARHDLRMWVTFPKAEFPGTLTKNLSLEGCCILGDFRSELGEILEFYLDLPDCSDPAKVTALVAWATGNEAGFRFINTPAEIEVRLLRSLGRSVVKPSSFLPCRQLTAPSYSYRLDCVGESDLSLLLSVANWDVEFVFRNGSAVGADHGAFERFVLQNSSEALTHLKSTLKVDLEHQREWLHLLLLDDDGNLVLEIWGEEISFQRVPREAAQAALVEVAGAY